MQSDCKIMKRISIVFLAMCLVPAYCKEYWRHETDNDATLDEMRNMKSMIVAIKEEMSTLTKKLERKQKELERKQTEFEDELDAWKPDLRSRFSKTDMFNGRHRRANAETQMYNEYGCELDIITLSCGENNDIYVTSAYYGQYNTPCESQCCPPHPTDDCTESMEEHFPIDWNALKETCDNQSTCAVQNGGGLVDTCTSPYYADYATVYYSCVPGDLSNVAFTAYKTSHQNINIGTVVMFEATITNIGNYYQPNTGVFICPISGVYLFSVTATSQNLHASTNLILEGELLVSSQAEDDGANQGVLIATVDCKAGERVWIEGKGDGHYVFGGNRYSTFSGVLLHQY